MNGIVRTWLLWKASRLRRRAERMTRCAIEQARELRRRADELEEKALQTTGGRR